MKGLNVNGISIDYLDKDVTKQILDAAVDLLNNCPDIRLVWPAAVAADQYLDHGSVYLTLLPLQRVGAPEGASGAKVLVAYFNDNSSIWCSKPLILKYDSITGKIKDKLQDEKNKFEKIKIFVSEFESSFASPIHLTEINDFRCLWSPFLSTTFSVDDRYEGIKPKEEDLWKFLTENVPPIGEEADYKKYSLQIGTLFNATYSYLRPMHVKFGMAKKEIVKLGELYEDYLRKYSEWINRWQLIWGTGKYVIESSSVVNPIYVLTELVEMQYSVQIGAVHGDIHPKNILLDSFNRPQIIDFGWAKDETHVLVDFALMEANLRFVTLHNPVPEKELESLTSLLTLEALKDESNIIKSSLYLDFVRESIVHIREKAKMIVDSSGFEKEYAISLFLISFGLLNYIESFKNQIATRRTVEMLAQHIYELLIRDKN